MNDLSQYRNDFPVLSTTMSGRPLAFLDTAASAQKPQVVIDAMRSIMEYKYSNIHRGLYDISQKLTEECEAVRGRVARFINAPSDKNIIFTSNTTDSINLVAQSWGRANLREGDEIIISGMEHHANIVPWQMLAEEKGGALNVIPVLSDGTLDIEGYKGLLSEKTKLVSIVHISNALGTINPINEIIGLAREFNPEIKVLIDGSQSIVHMPIDVQAMDADFFAFTGHKLYGPTGIGVLYGKKEILDEMPPYKGGGDMIERVRFEKTTYREAPFRFEAGTPPIIEIIGLGAAVDYCVDISMDKISQHENALLAYATERLQNIEDLTIHGPVYEGTPNKAGVISFTMDCAHTSDIGMVLNKCGVAVRSGHHCCMPLMESMGLDATVRASLGLYTNENDINQLVEGLHKVRVMFA